MRRPGVPEDREPALIPHSHSRPPKSPPSLSLALVVVVADRKVRALQSLQCCVVSVCLSLTD